LTSSEQTTLISLPPDGESSMSLRCSSSRSRTRFAGLRSRLGTRMRFAQLCSIWFSSTVKNYAGNSTGGSIWLIALPLLKFPQSLWILCCLLHISGMFLLCSVFKVQLLTIKVRFQYSVP